MTNAHNIAPITPRAGDLARCTNTTYHGTALNHEPADAQEDRDPIKTKKLTTPRGELDPS